MTLLPASILIPTYNRPDYLYQLLQYIKDNFNLLQTRIIVLDGSDKEAAGTNNKNCREACIEYHHFSPETPILERWLAGIKLVKTDYVSFLADDDILQPAAYYSCLDFLHAHPEYSAVHGDYIWFEENDKQISIYPGYQTFSIEQDNPLKRLFDFLSDYVPVTYALYRTDILKTAYERTVSSLDLTNLHFTELLTGCIPVIMGKVKKLPLNYYARNMGTSNSGHTTMFPPIVFSPDFSATYAKIKAVLIPLLSSEIDPLIPDKAIDFCFAAYYGQVLNKNTVTQLFTHLMHHSINEK